MVIFSGLFTAFGRLIGAVASMAIAWAATLLFGRVPQSRQTVLAFIAFGSVVWVVAILGVLVPTVGNLLISSVPQTPFIQLSWLRLAMLGLALFLPLAVGLGTVLLLPKDERKVRTIVAQALRGYPYTAAFAIMIFFLGAWGLVRQIHSLRNGWDSAHIPMIVKPRRYAVVATEIESALLAAGFSVVRSRADPWLTVPSRLVAALGGGSVTSLIPKELVELDADDLGILVYPFDVALLGRSDLVARARAVVARRLAVADAYLTSAEESEQLEDRLADLSRTPHVSTAEFALIDRMLDALVMPYEQWETMYWLRLQAEDETKGPAETRRADISEEIGGTPGGLAVESNALAR